MAHSWRRRGHLSRICGIRVASRDNPRVCVAIARTRAVTGRVVGPDGQPVAGVGLHLEPVDPTPLVKNSWNNGQCSGTSGADGAFRIEAAIGSMRIETIARVDGDWQYVELGVAGDDAVVVKMPAPPAREPEPPSPKLTVRVLDPQGRPVAAGEVHLYDERSDKLIDTEAMKFALYTQRPDGRWTSRELESQGGIAHLSLSQANSGRHRLRVVQTSGRSTLVYEGAIDPDPADDTIEIHLRPTVTLRISVRLGAGASWLGLRPAVKVKRGPFTVAAKPVEGAEGEFEAAGMVPGRCRVEVVIRNWIRVRVRSGDEVVGWNVVEVDVGPTAEVTVPIRLRE